MGCMGTGLEEKPGDCRAIPLVLMAGGQPLGVWAIVILAACYCEPFMERESPRVLRVTIPLAVPAITKPVGMPPSLLQ